MDEAAKQFSRLVKEFGSREKPERGDHHDPLPTLPMPWGQEFQKPTTQGNVHGGYVKNGGKKK